MGQPAISQAIYQLVTGSADVETIPCHGPSEYVPHEYSPLGLIGDFLLRSASTNNPKSSSGWRSPSGFTHLHRNIR
jgi:hypothetical protein